MQDQWVETAKNMGAGEICLTAHHEGGFCLWPTTAQNYSVAESGLWLKQGKKIDILDGVRSGNTATARQKELWTIARNAEKWDFIPHEKRVKLSKPHVTTLTPNFL